MSYQAINAQLNAIPIYAYRIACSGTREKKLPRLYNSSFMLFIKRSILAMSFLNRLHHAPHY